ncbi:MAG: hypothetical protein HKP32_00715 [Woeseia sp.]|nr:type VI secretion protein [Woeseia sp.]MBT8096624.1 type VI secretion protein [Woeseia sp.]NNL53654.1 hypothetical protein [Woeseia sp.]
MKNLNYLLAVALLHQPLSSLAATPDVSDCKKIKSDAQRLACYDAAFGTDLTAMQAVTTLQPTARDAVTESQASTAKDEVEGSRQTGSNNAENTPAQSAASTPELGAEQLKLETANAVTARLVGDFEGWTGRTIFRLDNGQVWQQTRNYVRNYKPREPIPSPEVTISKGMFSSYNLRVAGIKRAVQVKRLK